MSADPFCMSSCLAFRYVADPQAEWVPNVKPSWPHISGDALVPVRDTAGVMAALRRSIDAFCANVRVGLLLSSGIDSAILASLLPKGTPAFTIRFLADGAVDESPAAAQYAAACGLEHQVIDVSWDDCVDVVDDLMTRKKSILHAVEPALFKVSAAAAHTGLRVLALGNGADSTFGGLDKLLSRDWTFAEFMHRYTFVEPASVLREPVAVERVYAPYRRGDCVDTIGFLKTVHGLGVVQAFENAVTAAGCSTFQPYEQLALDAPLDIARIRRGESKYILREAFASLYPRLDAPEKIPFSRPMDCWLAGWSGPRRTEFRPDLEIGRFTGDQKWLIFCLERFLDLLDGGSLS